MESKSKWQKFKEYINSKDREDIITRQKLLDEFYDVPHYTIDTYKYYLIKMKILERIGWGIYKIKMKVPEKMTITDAKNMQRDVGTWKEWFIPLEDRIKK